MPPTLMEHKTGVLLCLLQPSSKAGSKLWFKLTRSLQNLEQVGVSLCEQLVLQEWHTTTAAECQPLQAFPCHFSS